MPAIVHGSGGVGGGIPGHTIRGSAGGACASCPLMTLAPRAYARAEGNGLAVTGPAIPYQSSGLLLLCWVLVQDWGSIPITLQFVRGMFTVASL